MSLLEKYPLESTKPLKKTISGSLVIFFIFLIFWFLNFISYLPFEVVETIAPELKDFYFNPFQYINLFLLTFLVLFVALKYIYETYYMKYYFYDLSGKNLIIRKGVFSRNEITLPINRLQDVYVDQDILDRLFGLYDVHVSSATAISGNLSHIDGINKNSAEQIKKLVLSGIHKGKWIIPTKFK